MLPKKLHKKLEERKANNAFRRLGSNSNLIDFSSNDYLGFSKSETIFNKAHDYIIDNNLKQNGATGSRLLSGNHKLYDIAEAKIARTHNTEAALVFNSGYDANLGFFSSVPQRGDIILYDEFCHASIRDGIRMSDAKSYKFRHNDLEDLDEMLKRVQYDNEDIFIVTESVFSMDGDSPDLKTLIETSKTYNARLIIDEAHALGIFDEGLVQQLGLENDAFARIITFGKALGCHGAAILSSKDLKDYLINFSRSFIYTTALPQHSLATILMAYKALEKTNQAQLLSENIQFFISEVKRLNLQKIFINSTSAIHCCIITGNDNLKAIAKQLQDKGFDVKPILSPTVPKGKERLRFCLHSYNSKKEISEVLSLLATFATQ
ncbi:pyridoxal phosphate-dependent aminotransferase family protein [uncultured Winogradskyella sp.]|uniref:aminotransferase class I/II-fold pyridoxal phosphate-dependent enzyme n=1 Tax=uncultured Winogradskyella sp. TaxID=395353 RepID=UPI0026129612|nr:pyridoxal phosphate-dependent aminotransferase family protein [uncultured Winogradskyella sp.]